MTFPSPIRPGDIVLSRGTGWISRAICLLDDSPVSHALLAHRHGRLAETVGQGLQTVTFDEAREGHDLILARTLATPADPEPVLAVADVHLERGARYAHQQIVLLAVLCLTRRAALGPGAHGMIRSVLDQAAAALNSMAERGQHPMICSEFVYRCYHEARPEAPYVLKIGTDDAHDGAPTLLQWAGTQPNLDAVAAPARLVGFDPAKAETALSPLIAAFSAAAGRPGLASAVVPPDTDTDGGLLASIGAFGAALHRTRTPRQEQDATRPPTVQQAVEAIRTTHAAPDFVTPGDLARTTSLTEIHRNEDTAPAIKTATQLLRR
ncbi:hypothetical protein [Yinghuangia soli]|uniref:Uncharacterized protein n=1 Tax=Yinghuangia soli TaxID=2908204 RepID=A0AA41PZN9_9ACTN|nr:hypothetical protein [Yinghuangia soli]MCF2528874.1 hypothetical protein [Yinghuangia soli]